WLMMSLWDALRMNMMISYQELVRTFPSLTSNSAMRFFIVLFPYGVSSEINTRNEICKAEKSIILCKSDITAKLGCHPY
ncbi:hypothetical protein L6E03_17085, partial [Enterobacter kobei]|uniref:hypothetical protein n=1 Tax=Enterobacter kobei TaxID=208224 RepID=UPI0023502DA2